jgi:hypothetical protein
MAVAHELLLRWASLLYSILFSLPLFVEAEPIGGSALFFW